MQNEIVIYCWQRAIRQKGSLFTEARKLEMRMCMDTWYGEIGRQLYLWGYLRNVNCT